MKNVKLFSALLLFGLLATTACELEDPNIGTVTEEVIELTVSDTELLADGKSRLTLTAELKEQADPNLDITFNTEAGFFPEAGQGVQIFTVTASGRTATAVLQSDNVNTDFINVTASVANFRDSKSIEFLRALPDDITVSADRQTVIANRVDFAQITTRLFRDNGQPTVGSRVEYEIIEQDAARATVVPFDFVNEELESVVNVKSENGVPGVVQIRVSVPGTEEEELLTIEFVEQ